MKSEGDIQEYKRECHLTVSQALASLLARFLFIPYGLATALLRYYYRVLDIVGAVSTERGKAFRSALTARGDDDSLSLVLTNTFGNDDDDKDDDHDDDDDVDDDDNNNDNIRFLEARPRCGCDADVYYNVYLRD
ncbi:hypothetical protein PUN28_018932 [Cardiocondyla obscurior]|uniref:Uncharacterized protein n=1 Tax=Cardiocondyla obscurior TaxID=286306 RepID=A0AAW2ECN1_9HYME